ncbi:hypothetical protein PAXRUDRAFT_154979, partial [Paxillus rubicundulus Ve08.2h10]
RPYHTVTVPQNAPPALMNHPPVPLNQFPGLPWNVIEQHEVQCTWCVHHPHPHPHPLPPPHIQAQPTLPIPPHGDVFYGGAAQPQQQDNQFPQQQQHYVKGVEARVDYTAAVMQATENAHAGRC